MWIKVTINNGSPTISILQAKQKNYHPWMAVYTLFNLIQSWFKVDSRSWPFWNLP